MPSDKERLDFVIKNGDQFLESSCSGGCCQEWTLNNRAQIDAAIRASKPSGRGRKEKR